MNKILVFFAAGCLGALANSLAVWSFGEFGITSSFGVLISPALTLNWLYPRIPAVRTKHSLRRHGLYVIVFAV